MHNLNDREWKEFKIGELFEVKRPSARNKDNYEIGYIPFVASGAMNNGVMKCCTPKENEVLDDGNCLTVSPVDGSTFYQGYDFLGRGGAGSSVLMLYGKKMNCYVGLFLSRCVQQTASKYSYGHMANKDGIKRDRFMLPVTDDGEPDYQFMEDYIKELMTKKRNQYMAYVDAKITRIRAGGYEQLLDDVVGFSDRE